MERTLAVKKLGKLLGKSLGYRVNDRAATAEDREVAKLDLPAAIEARDSLKQKRDARYQEILAADAEYQALKAATKVAQERIDALHSTMRHYKFTVGISNGMFFQVKAEGDSWEDVIDAISTNANKVA